MIGVYKIINKINGKMYIGSSINLKKRKTDHFKPYRINRLKHLPIYEAMIEFGRDNFKFEVIEECSEKDLLERENYYLDKYKTYENGYNVSSKAITMHDEKLFDENAERLRKMNNKNWADEEYRKQMSKANSDLQKERLKNPEYLAEKSKQLKKYTDSIKKPVGKYDKQGNLIATYEGVRDAERKTGINSQQISAVALGKPRRKSAGGYVWKYLQEKSVETIESN